MCDDFESDTAGMAPDSTLWHVFMGCNPNATNAATMGGLTVGIDNSQAHSGSNSLRIVGGDSCGYYAITTAAFASGGQLGSQLYTRFYARFSGAGTADAAATQNHNGFLSMYSGSTPGSDPSFFTNYTQSSSTSGQLRLGFQGGVVVWNNIINGKDATLPDIDTAGEMQSVSPGAGPWDCYEFHIDQTNGHIEFWFNGTAVPGASWDGTSTQGVSDQWSTQGPQSLQIQSFGLGWLHINDAETAWYDDVALAGSRIGCN